MIGPDARRLEKRRQECFESGSDISPGHPPAKVIVTPTGQTLCLCMIVKNEAHIIRRCLASVRPLLDHWIVVDTGSTDGTQDLVREAMAGLPGELVERRWVDFAHNRSEALALARPHGTYSFIIDADDELDIPHGFALPALEADSYTIDIRYGASTYRRPQLVRNALAWRYRGVVHEFLDCPQSQTQGHLPLVMRINHEGARSTDPQTYVRDAAILERALATESDPFLVARYTFYLAQSYRDCGDLTKAIDTYLRRAEMGYWVEEVFVSLYQAGRLMQTAGHDADAVLAVYARASATLPSRAEAAHAAAHLCRSLFRYPEGCSVAEPALGLPAPPDGLFVEQWIYDYALADEFAVNAYWCGRYRACLDACLRILQADKVPAAERPRILANMRFALDNLPVEPTSSPTASVPYTSAPVDGSASASPTLPATLHLGSGKDYRAEWFNVDIDATWNPDAVLDLSDVVLETGGVHVETDRFGVVTLRPGAFRSIVANDVLEHVPNLVGLMTTCLSLLEIGGVFEIQVPYDLAFGAWQDPTHVRTFNERSWLYYTDWFWYLGWREERFVLDMMEHVESPLGTQLREAARPWDEIVRTPRAIDAMRVRLRKIVLTAADRETLAHWRDRKARAASRVPEAAAAAVVSATGNAAGRGQALTSGSDRPLMALSEPWAAARARYCIYVVSPADYAHSQALHDAAGAMSEAFATLGGFAPVVTHPAAWQGRTPIVFGGHLLTNHPVAELPPEAILFNLEPLDAGSPWMSADYLARLKRHPLLDYSLHNTRALVAAGLGHARHFAIRAMPLLRPSAHDGNAEPDIDVLFYGSMNPRRRAALDLLLARGLKVVELFGVYGAERDFAVSRAKVVLNIHYYDAAVFEAVRVCPLLARGACVVSEGQADDPDVVDIAEGLVLAPLAKIAQLCRALVEDVDAREALSRRARAAIAKRSQADILRGMFPDAPQSSDASGAAVGMQSSVPTGARGGASGGPRRSDRAILRLPRRLHGLAK